MTSSNMLKFCFTLICLTFLMACLNKKIKEKHLPTYVDKSNKSIIIRKIDQLDQDSCSIQWHGGGLFSLCFEKGKVYYFFNPQCIYWYSTEIKTDKIIFNWDYNENCTFDRGLKNNYGLKEYPITGKPFGEFVLINDTTLRVKYYYEKWVNKINENTKDVDTLFPSIFRIKQR